MTCFWALVTLKWEGCLGWPRGPRGWALQCRDVSVWVPHLWRPFSLPLRLLCPVWGGDGDVSGTALTGRRRLGVASEPHFACSVSFTLTLALRRGSCFRPHFPEKDSRSRGQGPVRSWSSCMEGPGASPPGTWPRGPPEAPSLTSGLLVPRAPGRDAGGNKQMREQIYSLANERREPMEAGVCRDSRAWRLRPWTTGACPVPIPHPGAGC